MTAIRLLPLAAAVTTMLSLASAPASAASDGVEVAETVKTSAVVQTVDMETRQILLRDRESGDTFVITAGPEVKNLAQLDPGDIVQTVYTRGTAARMAPAGAKGAVTTEVVAAAKEGEKPAALIGQSTTEIVKILAYDAAGHVVTFEDAAGVVHGVTVKKPEMQRFAETLKPGDKVEVTFSDALAIGVLE